MLEPQCWTDAAIHYRAGNWTRRVGCGAACGSSHRETTPVCSSLRQVYIEINSRPRQQHNYVKMAISQIISGRHAD